MGRIVVTGATGYLGGQLCQYFLSQGHEVYAFSRNAPLHIAGSKITHCPFFLESPNLAPELKGADALIHCAYDLKSHAWKDIEAINIQGSLDLFRQAKDLDINSLIFISSVSAFAGCKSRYGRSKFIIEEQSRKLGVLSIRPGLIYGDDAKGLIGKMTKTVRNKKIIPIIGSGRQKMYTSHIIDLIQLIDGLISGALPASAKPITAASADAITFRELLQILRGPQKLRVMPLPARLIYFALRLLESCSIPVPYRSDSVTSLIYPPSQLDLRYIHENKIVFRDLDIDHRSSE